ncbi:SPOR domain-containing protein [Mucilaginibacter sp.]
MGNKGSALKTVAAVSAKIAVLAGLLMLPSYMFAQTRGKVEVDKDPKVDSLIGNYLVGGKAAKGGAAASSYGFRIQVFNGSDRNGAYTAQAKIQDRFPELHTYLSYRDPNFKVKVGDFRSRLEAEKMVEEMRPAFTGMYIISEKINLPKLDTE